jgi:hypothetical protein
MNYKVTSDGSLLFLMDENYQIDYIIDVENETLVITKKDENRQPIS